MVVVKWSACTRFTLTIRVWVVLKLTPCSFTIYRLWPHLTLCLVCSFIDKVGSFLHSSLTSSLTVEQNYSKSVLMLPTINPELEFQSRKRSCCCCCKLHVISIRLTMEVHGSCPCRWCTMHIQLYLLLYQVERYLWAEEVNYKSIT